LDETIMSRDASVLNLAWLSVAKAVGKSGCESGFVLVLEGDQGTGKSATCATLRRGLLPVRSHENWHHAAYGRAATMLVRRAILNARAELLAWLRAPTQNSVT
jgi:hypothetical protein